MPPIGRSSRGGHRDIEGAQAVMNSEEDHADDKPTDPPEAEKANLIEQSQEDFMKRKRVEIKNLPNDPSPEVCKSCSPSIICTLNCWLSNDMFSGDPPDLVQGLSSQ